MQDHDFPDEEDKEDVPSNNPRSQPLTPPKKDVSCPFAKETRCPASISIGDLFQAGKFVKPKRKEVVVLQLEQFDVKHVIGSTKETWNLPLRVQSLILVLFEMHIKVKKLKSKMGIQNIR